MAAFIKAGSLVSNGAPVLRKAIIGNSATMTTNVSVTITTTGFVVAASSATHAPFGHVDSIVNFAGTGPITTGATGAEVGSFLGTFAVTSNNQTVAKVSAIVDISKFSLYSVTPDAAIASTTGSNLLGYYTSLNDSQSTKENSATQTVPGTTQTTCYFIWGVDPSRATNQIVNLFLSQVFN